MTNNQFIVMIVDDDESIRRAARDAGVEWAGAAEPPDNRRPSGTNHFHYRFQ
jgi:hypothetical protein